MTEKQRWLLRDLEEWEKKQMQRIGQYGPPPLPPSQALASARRAVRKAEAYVSKLEKARRAPWEKAKAIIIQKRQAVKRTILFEKTDTALKALKALR